MKLSAAAALLLPFLFACSLHASSDATPAPTLLDKTLLALHLKHPPRPKDQGQLRDGMELKLDLSPLPVKLSEDREIKTTIDLFNRSNKYVHLNFPTTQRIEILVRDSSGKVVTTWSEDQSFTNDPATITVNPGERIEYTESVATREMTAGQPYVIEVSFPTYPDFKVQQQLVPQK